LDHRESAEVLGTLRDLVGQDDTPFNA
jgi:hypothetical protein